MTIRPLVLLPDPILKTQSRKLERVDASVRKLASQMLATMYDAPGIGLAAIQIREPVRMLVIDLAKEPEVRAPQVFINPQIVWSSDDRSVYEEGCLSIPDYYAEVERPSSVKVTHLDLDGKQHEITAEGLLATCLQHEIDHLNGILFIDHISKLKRQIVVRKFTKLARQRPSSALV